MSSQAEDLRALTPGERESFLEAIARHRRAAWRVTAASVLTLTAAAGVVALLSAPLWYAALALAADVLNLVTPTRDLLGEFMRYTDRWQDATAPIGAARWTAWLAIAALPGAVVMACLTFALWRALTLLVTHEGAALAGKVPHAFTLEEQRLRNVIAEMSIAASIPEPAVLIVENAGPGAGIFGTEREPRIVISRALLAALDRAELQGVAAHLVGSIAQGDLALGRRAALTLAFFNLMSRLALVLNERGNGKALARVFAGLLLPTHARLEAVALAVGDAFSSGPGVAKTAERTWRDYLAFVFAGPVVMLGFFGGIVSFLVLGPLLSLAWRQRKYMADATAVRLTRDPDTLARALEKLSASGGGAPLGRWAAHLAVASGPGVRSFMAGAFVPMLPSADQRLRALRKLGATLTRATRRVPLKKLAIMSALLGLVGVLGALLLPLLVYVSAALSALFLGLPVGIVHAVLRWLGH
jgi:Zn-dependent protease with chaperone function